MLHDTKINAIFGLFQASIFRLYRTHFKSDGIMNRMFLFSLLLWVTILALAQDINYQTANDMPYSTSGDAYARERCKLDVYYPTDLKDCPVVVWFHGGSLTSGSKFIPSQLMNLGMVVVAVNYRLLPQVAIGECIDDAAAALTWVFREVGRYNGSSKKVFVSGHSAGGYLAMMLGLDKRWLGKYGVDADDIAGLIPFSGQAISHFSYRKMQGIDNLQPTIDEFAPLFHVRKDASPLILITGDRELELFGRYEENAYLWRMMKLVGHTQTYLYEIDGYGHGPMAEPAFYILHQWIKRLLGQPSDL